MDNKIIELKTFFLMNTFKQVDGVLSLDKFEEYFKNLDKLNKQVDEPQQTSRKEVKEIRRRIIQQR